ncbi:MAG: dihydrodipicolinate synthase family protein [Phycisphaerales bacterium]|nr:dihydrodipicolinate synthase family protein [Phycisphaerales bacterium]
MTTTSVEFGGRTITIPHDPWREIRERTPVGLPPCRVVQAAAHVVMQPSYAAVDHSTGSPGHPDEIAQHVDWEATMAFRSHLAAHGFGIAEAMDTAQRFELGWTAARELIRRCGDLRLPTGFVAGASVDHLDEVSTPSQLIDGVIEQVGIIQAAGGIAVLLPMPLLTRWQADEQQYVDVYTAIIDGCEGPLITHWLGEMFLPELAGYFPGDSFLRIMRHDPTTVRAAKLSLLDPNVERRLAHELRQQDQFMLTGDDYNFAPLLTGVGTPDGQTSLGDIPVPLGPFSHGLLGIFDGIAAPAEIGLRALAAGHRDDAMMVLMACQQLGRAIFEPPVHRYKAGLAFLAWLNGHQDTFDLVNHVQRERSLDHYAMVLQLAADAGALTDVETATDRLGRFPALD